MIVVIYGRTAGTLQPGRTAWTVASRYPPRIAGFFERAFYVLGDGAF